MSHTNQGHSCTGTHDSQMPFVMYVREITNVHAARLAHYMNLQYVTWYWVTSSACSSVEQGLPQSASINRRVSREILVFHSMYCESRTFENCDRYIPIPTSSMNRRHVLRSRSHAAPSLKISHDLPSFQPLSSIDVKSTPSRFFVRSSWSDNECAPWTNDARIRQWGQRPSLLQLYFWKMAVSWNDQVSEHY